MALASSLFIGESTHAAVLLSHEQKVYSFPCVVETLSDSILEMSRMPLRLLMETTHRKRESEMFV